MAVSEHMKAENPMANMASLDDGVAESPETSVDTLQQPRTIKNDVEKEVDLENADNSYARRLSSSLDLTGTTNIVSFTDDDPGNPYNWSSIYKAWIVFLGILTVMSSTIGSSIPSNDIPELSAHFGVSNEQQLVLPNSIYLIGYVLGPLLFGPLSESYGRQVIMLVTFAGYTVFTLGACVAPNYAAFIIFRLLTGIFAASPISVTGGIYADLYRDPITRGRAMASFLGATTLGPIAGPIISGYLGPYGWRWPFWFCLILAGITWPPLVFLPETFGPTILKRRAKKIRKNNPDVYVVAPIELEKNDLRELVIVILTRPVRMFFTEAIVLCSSLYLSLVYALLYMFFQAYPLIYPSIYGFTLGQEGLAFVPNGIGAIISCAIYFWWDHHLYVAKSRNAPWTSREEYRRLPLACLGGPLFALGIFWIGWTARSSIPWIVPILGGLPLGMGYLLLFIALMNYIVDAYEVFAASALAAAGCSRSLFGAVLPFAAAPMFERLGVAWACSMLGFLSVGMCLVPFVFIRYGDKIRKRSKFCQALVKKKRQVEEDEEARRLKMAKRAERTDKARERLEKGAV